MKKLIMISVGLIVLFGSMLVLANISSNKSSNIYNFVTETELEQKINNKETFVIYIYGKNCSYCTKFAPTLDGFLNDNNYKINKIMSDDSPNLKKIIGDTYQGTPSIYVFKEGLITDYIIGQKTLKELENFVRNNKSVFSN